MICRMFMTVTMESAIFMGKNFQNNRHSIVNTADLTLKHMFDICEIGDSTRGDLRFGNSWENIPGNICN